MYRPHLPVHRRLRAGLTLVLLVGTAPMPRQYAEGEKVDQLVLCLGIICVSLVAIVIPTIAIWFGYWVKVHRDEKRTDFSAGPSSPKAVVAVEENEPPDPRPKKNGQAKDKTRTGKGQSKGKGRKSDRATEEANQSGT